MDALERDDEGIGELKQHALHLSGECRGHLGREVSAICLRPAEILEQRPHGDVVHLGGPRLWADGVGDSRRVEAEHEESWKHFPNDQPGCHENDPRGDGPEYP